VNRSGRLSGTQSTWRNTLTIRPLPSLPEASEKIGLVEAKIVDVSGPGVNIRWYIDPAPATSCARPTKPPGLKGLLKATTDLSNWQTTDGITLPALHTNQLNGEESSSPEFTQR